MNCHHLIFRWIILAGLLSHWGNPDAASEAAGLPRTFLLDAQYLAAAKQRTQAGDRQLAPALKKLLSEAEASLKAGPFTIVDQWSPPNGNAHDYMSQAPYFWPNPETSNGLPYIRKDGQRNPEIKKYPDHQILDDLVEAVETLALAFYFNGNEHHAARASELLRIFFLEEKTRMNPRFQFAQAVPGLNDGRGIGIIEARGFIRLVDAIGLLKGSKHWTGQDQTGLVAWYGKLLEWMLESKNGREEAAAQNNHGTFYDAQVSSYALFVGNTNLARRILEEARTKRIVNQIEPDGRQPLELVRTRAWSYSVGNLQGLFNLARLGECVGVDLWNYESGDGRSLRKALDYLTPYSIGKEKWPHQQIGGFSPEALHSTIRRAGIKYPKSPYNEMVKNLPALPSDHRSHLVR